ncbi:MAG TPA: M3 family metallopeptidase [Rhodanobacteraceae bacterium]|nr:M3 family metallopeptidase [Rhodanobacteraceae bacterium]
MQGFRRRALVLACCALVAGGAGTIVTANAAAPPQAHPATGAPAATNPFFEPSTLPFGTPDFAKIKDSDYVPAMEAGMRRQAAEIDKIANDPAAPTFENTIVAMEKTGQLLTRVMNVFSLYAGADTNPTLQKISEEQAPKLAAHQDAIYLNPKLFARIQKVYDERATLKLDPESQRLLEVDYHEFVLNGAKLSKADQASLKHYNEQISTLTTQFGNKLIAAAKAGALVLDSKADLAGLSPAQIEAAAQTAKARGLAGKWVILLQNTTQQPDLAALSNRKIRHELYEHSINRADHGGPDDTRAIITEIAYLRAQKARLLGFDDFAAWKLEDQMAKTPATVMHFLDQLVPPAKARAEAEADARQQMIDKDQKALGKPAFKLEPWDWEYYGQQVQKARYDIDESEVKPYFELHNVLVNGVFYAATQLYGITFKQVENLPTWNPDVLVYEVYDANGKPLGLFYADYFKRDNKAGGAWMSDLVHPNTLLHQSPVIYNVANFAKPAPGQPALLSMDDVITMFHEFGHALNAFFADTRYPSLSGTDTARDWVEFPSQFNEHWATYPAVFDHYAVNYKTGQPMPKALVDKLRKSRLFNKGYDMTELLEAALLDMSWHTLPASHAKIPVADVSAFENQALAADHILVPYVPPRYRSTYFLHIWGNGYAAGYYAYLWTQMLADDAYGWFGEHGGLTRANGDRFRRMILSRGNTEDLATMYQAWRGRAPTIDAMKKDRGLEAK